MMLAHSDGALEDVVANDMSVGIVDEFEMVHVDEDETAASHGLGRVAQCLFCFVDEMLAIEDAGKAIPPSQAHETQLGTPESISRKPIDASVSSNRRYRAGL